MVSVVTPPEVAAGFAWVGHRDILALRPLTDAELFFSHRPETVRPVARRWSPRFRRESACHSRLCTRVLGASRHGARMPLIEHPRRVCAAKARVYATKRLGAVAVTGMQPMPKM